MGGLFSRKTRLSVIADVISFQTNYHFCQQLANFSINCFNWFTNYIYWSKQLWKSSLLLATIGYCYKIKQMTRLKVLPNASLRLNCQHILHKQSKDWCISQYYILMILPSKRRVTRRPQFNNHIRGFTNCWNTIQGISCKKQKNDRQCPSAPLKVSTA